MKVSHIIYKVDNLEKGMEQFRQQGFKVTYGSKKNPHNALIYFSEGPYIELLSEVHFPSFFKFLLRLIGKGKVVDRIEKWEQAAEGPVELCLENYGTNFAKEKAILKKWGQKYFTTKSKRLDPSDRLLRWKMLFPDELQLPFLMTYFTIDPKPKNFIHPNGIKRIKSIAYGTTAALIPLIEEISEDDSLELFIGQGIKDVSYEL